MDAIEKSRVRPHRGVINVDEVITGCYSAMAWRVRLVLLRDQLQSRFGASSVILHTMGLDGKWIGRGKVRAEFFYS